MPEDDSGSEISESRDQSTGHRWRGRLLSKTGKLAKAVDKAIREKNAFAQQETDVSDFLHGPGDRAAAKPRLDTTSASRWPAAAVVLSTAERPGSSSSRPATPSSRPATSQSSNIPLLPPRRRKVAKGLRVTFTAEAPVVIGEGGDEAELPSKDVVRAWMQLGGSLRQQQVHSTIDRSEVRREAALPESLIPAHDRKPMYSPPPKDFTTLQRKPVASSEDRRRIEEAGPPTARSQHEAGLSTPGQSEIRQGGSLPRPYPGPERSPMSRPGTFSGSPTPALGVRSQIMGSRLSVGNRLPAPQMASSRGRSHAPEFFEANLSQESIGTVPSVYLRATDDASSRPTETPITPTHGYKDVVSPFLDEFLDDRSTQGSVGDNNLEDNSKLDGKSDEFYSRVEHLRGVFHLASQRSQAAVDESLALWIRASTWWFLKGRNGLGSNARTAAEQHHASQTTPQIPTQALQCYVDLAKAWWIAREIIPEHLLRVQSADSESIVDSIDGLTLPLLEHAYASLQSSMDALTTSMQKYRLLPPHGLLIQGLDTRIWVDYPVLSPDILALTADVDPKTALKRTQPDEQPFFPVLLGDSERHFSYGRMFVEVEIVSEYDGLDEYQLPCVLSIVRERADSRVEVTIVSQDGVINLHVQSDRNRQGPTWDDVEWKVRSHSARIHLAEGFELAVRFWEVDFKTLWDIYDYNRRVEKDWCAREDEVVVFNDVVDNFHYIPPTNSQNTFPSKPVRSCKVRLFEASCIPPKSSGQEGLHTGHRLMAMTPPESKTLSSIGATFGPANPVLFSYLRGEGGRPALLLSVRDQGIKSTMVLTFAGTEKRAEVHALLNGTLIWPDESQSAKLPLKDFRVSLVAGDPAMTSRDLAFVPDIKWEYVRLIEKNEDSQHPKTSSSGHRRICVRCNLGNITDRISSGMLIALHPVWV